MGLMKKLLWDASPAVIIGKKVQDARQTSKQNKPVAAAAQQPAVPVAQPNKKEKRLSLSGAYYSSHPDVHGYSFLKLEFGQDGVYVLAKKDIIKTFSWDQVSGFKNQAEEKSDLRTSQRVTATRMAAVGVFALAAPKSNTKGSIESKFYYVLHTTSGDIELENGLTSGSGGGSMGEMNRNITKMMINKQSANANSIKRFVAEHATGKAPTQPSAVASSADELERYAKLKESGVISQEEFDAKKRQLLNL